MSRYSHDERRRLREIVEWIQTKNAELERESVNSGVRQVGTPGGNWRTPQKPIHRLVPPGHRLTQYGTTDSARPFREFPRHNHPAKVETAVSMILGSVTVHEAALLVTRKSAKPTATVRYFRTADLWLAGYLIAHTPNEKNRKHVSVHYQAIYEIHRWQEAMAVWDQEGRVTLESLAIPATEAKP